MTQAEASNNRANKTAGRDYGLTHLQSSSQKDEEWIEQMCDHYIRHNNLVSTHRSIIQTLYETMEGLLDDDDYRYVTNPLNADNENYQKFPARLRNYDIIKPIVNAFLGENSRRRHGMEVIVGNSDAQDKRKDSFNEQMSRLIAQDFVNNLNAMGVETGVPSQEIQGYKEAKQDFDENYDDKRARFGQQALDYLYHNLNLDEKIQLLKYDWVVAGRVCTYKDLRYQDVGYRVCDPRDVSVIGWGDSTYAEDAEGVVHARRVTSSEVLAQFFEEISEREDKDEILEYLDESMFKDAAFTEFSDLSSNNYNERRSDRDEVGINDTRNMVLYHTTFNTITPVKILHYYDEFGAEREMYVDDTYELDEENGDIRIENLTIREWYECWRLDDKFYFDGGRGRVQRHMVNNISSCKLPYNMALFGYRQGEPDSVVRQLLQYQQLYNIFHYRWELLLAQNKGKIMLLPRGIIPDGGGRGWDEDKFFYFMESMKLAVYDETAPNANALLQGIKSIDLELGNSIDRIWNNMLAIKNEAWEQIGMNRQRYGQTYASDGKATTEQAIVQSNTITAAWQFQFDKFMEMEYRGMLDYSKVAFIDGKKAAYINSEGKKAWFELSKDEALEFLETDFNIFVRNSVFENEKHDKAQNLVLTMGQNGLTPDVMLDVLDANSFVKMKKLVKEGLAAERQFQQSLKQMDQQTAQMQIQAEAQKQDKDNATKIEVAKIQANAKLQAAQQAASAEDMMSGLIEDTNDMAQDVDTAKISSNLHAKEQSMVNSNRAAADDQIKREQMASNERIAKENKNKYDK